MGSSRAFGCHRTYPRRSGTRSRIHPPRGRAQPQPVAYPPPSGRASTPQRSRIRSRIPLTWAFTSARTGVEGARSNVGGRRHRGPAAGPRCCRGDLFFVARHPRGTHVPAEALLGVAPRPPTEAEWPTDGRHAGLAGEGCRSWRRSRRLYQGFCQRLVREEAGSSTGKGEQRRRCGNRPVGEREASCGGVDAKMTELRVGTYVRVGGDICPARGVNCG